MKHPYETMDLKPDDTIWVLAKVRKIFPKGTLGYASGFVEADVITSGLAGGDQRIVTTVRHIKKGAL